METPNAAQAEAAAADPFKELGDRMAPRLEALSQRMADTNDRVKTFVKDNPGVTLLGAAAIGFFAGRWASRS